VIRILFAVVAGYAAIGALIVITDQIFAALIPGFQSMIAPPLYYFVASLVTDWLYAMTGGYLCCAIAREGYRSATVGLMAVGELIGIAAQIVYWQTIPHWYGLALLVIYPLSVWMGSQLRWRAMQKKG